MSHLAGRLTVLVINVWLMAQFKGSRSVIEQEKAIFNVVKFVLNI
jgi:hypothetical protein